mmetsp:Transcript_31198/g.48844  ORF Transcript_31198/g.48844 Transcript_31198/m.48844 type:complete len:122 (-) Transcript_31198:1487-1852(-)
MGCLTLLRSCFDVHRSQKVLKKTTGTLKWTDTTIVQADREAWSLLAHGVQGKLQRESWTTSLGYFLELADVFRITDPIATHVKFSQARPSKHQLLNSFWPNLTRRQTKLFEWRPFDYLGQL